MRKPKCSRTKVTNRGNTDKFLVFTVYYSSFQLILIKRKKLPSCTHWPRPCKQCYNKTVHIQVSAAEHDLTKLSMLWKTAHREV